MRSEKAVGHRYLDEREGGGGVECREDVHVRSKKGSEKRGTRRQTDWAEN